MLSFCCSKLEEQNCSRVKDKILHLERRERSSLSVIDSSAVQLLAAPPFRLSPKRATRILNLQIRRRWSWKHVHVFSYVLPAGRTNLKRKHFFRQHGRTWFKVDRIWFSDGKHEQPSWESVRKRVYFTLRRRRPDFPLDGPPGPRPPKSIDRAAEGRRRREEIGDKEIEASRSGCPTDSGVGGGSGGDGDLNLSRSAASRVVPPTPPPDG